MRARYSEIARADIDALYLHGIVAFGLAKADAYAEGLGKLIDRIAAFPDSAPEGEGAGQGFRILPYRAHIVVYAADPSGVIILRVRHAREDWMSDPRGFEP